MYRDRDLTTNTISGLLRGTAGTAITAHNDGAIVYNLGRSNLLPAEYQDYIDSNTFMGDNTTTEFVTDIVVDNRPIVYIGGMVDVYVNSAQLPTTAYTVTQVEPVVVVINGIPQAGTQVDIVVTWPDSTQYTTSITATGSSARFATDTDIGLVEQPSNTYVLDSFDPLTITFDTAPLANHVVYIRNQLGAETQFEFSFADGVETTFATEINLSIPVRVYVGGIELLTNVGYLVTSLDPVTVLFDEPPPNSIEIVILVRDGVTWYAPGITTPSDGVPLQVTETKPARFLRGL